MATAELTKLKCILQFGDKNGSYTLNNLKSTAFDDDIVTVANAINDLQDLPFAKMLKVEEFELKD